MRLRQSRDLADESAGFTTAAFSVIVFGLALIAAAAMMVASQELQAANHDVRTDQEFYFLQGVANAGEVRLLSEAGAPTLRWSQSSAFGRVVVTLEPEALKIAPSEIARPENARLIASLIGNSDAERLEAAATGLQPAADGVLHRSQIIALANAARWRECATTMISPYSRLSAFNLSNASESTGQDDNRHAGELWRVAVDAEDGTWLDRIVRMTGAPAEPVGIVEEDAGKEVGNGRTSCLSDIERFARLEP